MDILARPFGERRTYALAKTKIASPAPTKWNVFARVLHWITVAMLLGLLIIAFILQGPGLAMMIWMPWHISLGFALLGVTALRLVARIIDRRRPSVVGWVARLIQAALYVVVIAVILTGWLAYRPTPLIPPAKLFGYAPIPVIHFPLTLPWISWHQALVWLLLGLVTLHTAAATYHLVVLKDRVFSGMLFGRDSSD